MRAELQFNNSCGCFFALSDRTRQRILEMLREHEMCVSEICQEFEIAQPSISHHLDVLKRMGLVRGRRRGREVYYELDRERLCQCCGTFFERMGMQVAEKG